MGNICSKAIDDDDDNEEKIDVGLDEKQLKEMEEDLKEVDDDPEYIDIEGNRFNVRDGISEANIKEPYLREIFLDDNEAAIRELHEVRLKRTEWKKEYEQDLLLAFWFAIDRKNIVLA